MKRLIFITLCFTLLVIPIMAYGAGTNSEKDPEEIRAFFENEPNYSYDKFEKSWNYFEGALKQYSDAVIVLGLKVGGEASVVYPPQFYTYILDPTAKGARQYLYSISNVAVLIGETIYSFPLFADELGESYTFIIEPYKEFLKVFSEADPTEIAVKLTGTGLDLIIEEFDDNTLEALQYGAGIMYDSNVWDYTADDEMTKNIQIGLPMEIIE